MEGPVISGNQTTTGIQYVQFLETNHWALNQAFIQLLCTERHIQLLKK